MNVIDLPDDVAAWAEAEVAAGRAASVAELIAFGLHRLRAQDADLRGLIGEGMADVEAGRVVDLAEFEAACDQHLADLAAKSQ